MPCSQSKWKMFNISPLDVMLTKGLSPMTYTVKNVLKWTAVNSCINVDLTSAVPLFKVWKSTFCCSPMSLYMFTYIIINLSKISPMKATSLLMKNFHWIFNFNHYVPNFFPSILIEVLFVCFFLNLRSFLRLCSLLIC